MTTPSLEDIEAFTQAAEDRNIPEIEKMLGVFGKDIVNALNVDGKAALHIAAREGYDYVVHLLVAAGADINLANNQQRTPLMIAVNNNNETTCLALISAGAKLDATGEQEETALHIACRCEYPAMVKILLQAGANKDAPDKYLCTPLMIACMGNIDVKVINLLLAAGANPCLRDSDGETAHDMVSRTNNVTLALALHKAEQAWLDKEAHKRAELLQTEVAVFHQGLVPPLGSSSPAMSLRPPRPKGRIL